MALGGGHFAGGWSCIPAAQRQCFSVVGNFTGTPHFFKAAKKLEMYKYHDPATVLSPQDCIDSVTTIFDGGINKGAFSLAKVVWQGDTKIAIRWNVTEREWAEPNKINGSVVCVGEPNSRGYATWFILPNDFLLALLAGSGEIADALRKALAEIETK